MIETPRLRFRPMFCAVEWSAVCDKFHRKMIRLEPARGCREFTPPRVRSASTYPTCIGISHSNPFRITPSHVTRCPVPSGRCAFHMYRYLFSCTFPPPPMTECSPMPPPPAPRHPHTPTRDRPNPINRTGDFINALSDFGDLANLASPLCTTCGMATIAGRW